jgi:hypothetical protein
MDSTMIHANGNDIDAYRALRELLGVAVDGLVANSVAPLRLHNNSLSVAQINAWAAARGVLRVLGPIVGGEMMIDFCLLFELSGNDPCEEGVQVLSFAPLWLTAQPAGSLPGCSKHILGRALEKGIGGDQLQQLLGAVDGE